MSAFPNLKRGEMNYTAIAFYALKRLPEELKTMCRERGAWQDVLCWCFVAAVEGEVNRYDFKQTYNAAQRYIYLALKAEGFHRQSQKHGRAMQYQNRESVSLDDLKAQEQ
jgi:hypothetical protein